MAGENRCNADIFAEDGSTVPPMDQLWRAERPGPPGSATTIIDTAELNLLDEARRDREGNSIVGADGMVSFGSASYYLGASGAVLGRWDDAERNFEEAIAVNAAIGACPTSGSSESGMRRCCWPVGRQATARPSVRRSRVMRTSIRRNARMPCTSCSP
jgi:hypothetical protein